MQFNVQIMNLSADTLDFKYNKALPVSLQDSSIFLLPVVSGIYLALDELMWY